MTDQIRPNRKTIEGWVVSDRMDKTRVIHVRHLKRDSKYGKIMRLTSKVHAHDDKNESKAGDRVRLMSSRPLSKTKRWRVTKVLEKA